MIHLTSLIIVGLYQACQFQWPEGTLIDVVVYAIMKDSYLKKKEKKMLYNCYSMDKSMTLWALVWFIRKFSFPPVRLLLF